MKIAIALILSLGIAHAETYLYAGAWSKHLEHSEIDYNESHNLLAVEHRQIVVGGFRNSWGRDSWFAAYRWTWTPLEHVEASVLAGGVYGYSHCWKGEDGGGRKICPMLSPGITYTRWRVQPSVLLLGNAVGVTVRWRLYPFINMNSPR